MKGLFSQFDESLAWAVGLTVVAIAFAAAGGFRDLRSGQPWLGGASRVLAVGAVLVIIVSTALPWSGVRLGEGDLVLTPGRGGLGNIDNILADPNSLAGVLLLSNVVLYIPVAFFGALGWYNLRRFVIPASLGLSVLVETMQLLILGRVAATDDVLLNIGGAAIGFGTAVATVRWVPGLSAALGISADTTRPGV